jgi:hypothetical protein
MPLIVVVSSIVGTAWGVGIAEVLSALACRR